MEETQETMVETPYADVREQPLERIDAAALIRRARREHTQGSKPVAVAAFNASL